MTARGMTYTGDEIAVARAMYEHDLAWVGTGTAFKSWDETSAQDLYLDRARAAIAAMTGPSPFIPDNDATPPPTGDDLVEAMARQFCNDLHLDTVWDKVPEDIHDADYPQGRELYRWAVRNLIAAMLAPPVAVSEAMVEAGARALWEFWNHDLIPFGASWDVVKEGANVSNMFEAEGARKQSRACLTAALAGQEDQHPDDLAVDAFAERMKAKLAKKRADGRGGWEDRETCSTEFLSGLLREHVEKGDPVDVANLAMMLEMRGDRIAALGVQEAPLEGDEPLATDAMIVERIADLEAQVHRLRTFAEEMAWYAPEQD